MAGEKERRERGEKRSSTAGLKTYVTVGSQQVKWERKLGATTEYKCHFIVIFSYSSFDFVAGI